MPQITKARIVNFYYNDGKRLITNEILNFENSDKHPCNALINLINGGGKSVLVQLLLQTVLPKSSLCGRKISSYFNNASAHFFVLTEWQLDNSKDRLLTGISLGAGESNYTSDENDSVARGRGINVKYYTFTVNYNGLFPYAYDLCNFPLTENVDNKFIPKAFEYIRQLGKTESRIKIFSSDESKKYGETLMDYGISQDEWKSVAESVNQTEGGIREFFSSIKKGDQLIDRMLIPAIEKTKQIGMSDSQESLKTMIKNFAKSYSERDREINIRDNINLFLGFLDEIRPQVEELWEINNEYEKSYKTLYGFSLACHEKSIEIENALENDHKSLDKAQNELKSIQHEELSAKYYEINQKFTNIYIREKELAKELSKCEDRITQEERNKTIHECAQLNEEIIKCISQIDINNKIICNKENDKDIDEELQSLKFTILELLQTLIPEKQDELAAVENELDNFETEKQKLDDQKTDAIKNVNELNRKIERLIGVKDEKKKYIAQLYNEIFDKEISFLLDDRISISELKENEKSLNTKADSIEKNIQEINNSLQKLNNKYNENLDLLEKQISVLSTLKNEIADEQKILDDYNAIELELKKIYERNSFNFESRFELYGLNHLKEEKDTISANLNSLETRKKVLELQTSAIKDGALHIPTDVFKYLKEINLTFTTGENYLFNYEPEVKSKILASHPEFAYGIVVDDKNLSILLSEEREWLSSVLPIFTHEDIDLILRSEYKEVKFLANYCQDYFDDKDKFVNNLSNQISKINSELEITKNHYDQVIEDLETLEKFKYDINFKADLIKRIDILNKKLSTEVNLRSQLAEENKEIQLNINQGQSNLNEAIINQKSLDDKLKKFNGFELIIGEYYEVLNYIGSLEEECDTCDKELSSVEKQIEVINNELDQCRLELKVCQEGLEQYNKVFDKVRDARPASLLNGTYNELVVRYDTLLNNLGDDIRKLQRENDELNSKIKKAKEKLQKKGLREQEYCNVTYSEVILEGIDLIIKDLQKTKDSINKDLQEVKESKGGISTQLRQAEQNLLNFGGNPLPEEQLLGDYIGRIKQKTEEIEKIKEDTSKLTEELNLVKNALSKAEDFIDDYTTQEVISVELSDDLVLQLNSLRNTAKNLKQELEKREKDFKSIIKQQTSKSYSYEGCQETLKIINYFVNESIKGDRFYSLNEILKSHIENYKKRLNAIMAELNDYDNYKKDLINKCLGQGKKIAEELIKISHSTRLKLKDSNRRQVILKIDLPQIENIDESIAYARIEEGVAENIKLIVDAMRNDKGENEINKLILSVANSRKLLNWYLGQNSIPVQVFKIDFNEQNSKYRSWEDADVDNSGAEKFVVYFSVLLAIMSYTRSSLLNTEEKLNSTLVLDNPFGPITSEHLLRPMFMIAEHFGVQLICFSDITKTDLTKQFDVVIKAVVVPINLSTMEVLKVDTTEMVEHAAYNVTQISLL